MYPGPVNSCPVVVFCPKAGTLRYSATSPTSTTSNRDAAIVSLYMLRSFAGNSIWKMESALVTIQCYNYPNYRIPVHGADTTQIWRE